MAEKKQHPGMANLRTPTTAEAREIGRLGGIASGEARRKKATMRETTRAILDMQLNVDDAAALSAYIDGIAPGITVDQAIAIAQAVKAAKGDTQAAIYVRDTAGYKPTDKTEIDQDITIKIETVSK